MFFVVHITLDIYNTKLISEHFCHDRKYFINFILQQQLRMRHFSLDSGSEVHVPAKSPWNLYLSSFSLFSDKYHNSSKAELSQSLTEKIIFLLFSRKHISSEIKARWNVYDEQSWQLLHEWTFIIIDTNFLGYSECSLTRCCDVEPECLLITWRIYFLMCFPNGTEVFIKSLFRAPKLGSYWSTQLNQ